MCSRRRRNVIAALLGLDERLEPPGRDHAVVVEEDDDTRRARSAAKLTAPPNPRLARKLKTVAPRTRCSISAESPGVGSLRTTITS